MFIVILTPLMPEPLLYGAAAGFFANSARPDFIMEIDGISNRELRRYSLGFNAQDRGFWKAFKAHFINQGVKIQPTGCREPSRLTAFTNDEGPTRCIHTGDRDSPRENDGDRE
jgi:hypothetical protein